MCMFTRPAIPMFAAEITDVGALGSSSGAWLPVAMVELPTSTGGVADLPVFVDEKYPLVLTEPVSGDMIGREVPQV